MGHYEVRLGENIVHSMHDTESDILAVALRALGKTNEVVNKDTHVGDGPSVFHQWGMLFKLQQRRCKLCKL